MSGKNIYICETEYASKETETDATWIRKLSYENGELKAVAQAKVQGVLNDSFSIDEYEGNLRLVTTVTPGFGKFRYADLTRGRLCSDNGKDRYYKYTVCFG